MRHLIATALLVVLFVTAGFAQEPGVWTDDKPPKLVFTEAPDRVEFVYASEDAVANLQYSEVVHHGTAIKSDNGFDTQWHTTPTDGKYYMRAYAVYGETVVGSEYMEAYYADSDTLGWEFTTIQPLPDKVVLVAPPDGAVNLSVNPDLTWQSAEHADEYRLQVASDTTFSALVLDTVTSDTTYQVLGLDHNTTYRWRVRGLNSAGAGEWSGN